jgi:hypothetical protein
MTSIFFAFNFKYGTGCCCCVRRRSCRGRRRRHNLLGILTSLNLSDIILKICIVAMFVLNFCNILYRIYEHALWFPFIQNLRFLAVVTIIYCHSTEKQPYISYRTHFTFQKMTLIRRACF